MINPTLWVILRNNYKHFFPIFSSGMRSSATQRAKINLEKAEDDLTETEQRLKFKISASKNDYQFAIHGLGNL